MKNTNIFEPGFEKFKHINLFVQSYVSMKYSEFSSYIIQLKVKINPRCYTVPLALYCLFIWGFTSGSVVKNPSAIQEPQEMQAGSLCHEDPLEEGRQPTPVFFPGEFHGQRSLAGHTPQGCKESDKTERLIMRHALIYSLVKLRVL